MIGRRLFTTSIRRLQGGKISPTELLKKKSAEAVEQEEFKKTLLEGKFKYKPKTLSKIEGNKPVPINVELLQYKPIRLPKTHGHEVVDLRFRGYVEDDLNLAAEFASRAAYYLGIPVSVVTKLKTEKRLYTVIKSPFAQAKSKENFWRVTYNFQLKAFDANPEVIDLWLSYINKYALEGVNYNAKVHIREAINGFKKLDKQPLVVPEGFKDSDDPFMAKVEELLASDAFKNLK